MAKLSVDDDFKPTSVFVEDAEAQGRLGSYNQNVNARYGNTFLVALLVAGGIY